MANKTVCDRCGKEINRSIADNFAKHLYLKECGLMAMGDIDLCEDCEKQLYDWLKNEDKGCKCNNVNVIELVDQLEAAEKRICTLSEENTALAQQNEMLKNETVERLLSKCHFTVDFSID